MKKLLKSNQFAITSLAIMIAVAGYLNFTKSEVPTISDSSEVAESAETIDTMDISDGDSLVSEKVDDELPEEDVDARTIGDTVLTDAEVSEYVARAKLNREQSRAKTKESLNEIIENDSASDSAKEEALKKLTALAETIEKEAEAEQLLEAKGYGNALVSIGNDSVDIVLNYEELSQADRAQIEDIVTRKTGYAVSKIVISRMAVLES